MADEQLLSDLCSICHVQAPKYKCPRCSTRTCSLECVKRHKKRADCSGQRDPTGFVKKAQLYTASGVDHDFNFITGIEEKASTAERLVSEATADQWHTPKRQYALATALQRTGVRVEKAPKGLSRQLQNRTRWAHNSNSIMWTVEWVEPDQTRHLDDVSERTPLCDAHHWHMRRVRGEMSIGQRRNKRRKLAFGKRDAAVEDAAEDLLPALSPDARDIEANENIQSETEARPVEASGQHDGINTETQDDACPAAKADLAIPPPFKPELDSKSAPETQSDPVQNADAATAHDPSTQPPPSSISTSNEPQPSPSPPPPGAPDEAGNHYYLIKPRTPIPSTVLIPLSPRAPLSHSLRGRAVIEFPTVQILKQPPTALPEGFVLEREYGLFVGRQEEELRRVAGEVVVDVGPKRRRDREMEREDGERKRIPNSSDIQAILERDVLC